MGKRVVGLWIMSCGLRVVSRGIWVSVMSCGPWVVSRGLLVVKCGSNMYILGCEWVMGRGLWVVGHELWVVDFGLFALGRGTGLWFSLGVLKCGLWVVGYGVVDCGLWVVGLGLWVKALYYYP